MNPTPAPRGSSTATARGGRSRDRSSRAPASGEEGVCEGEEILEENEEPVSCAFGTSVALDNDGSTGSDRRSPPRLRGRAWPGCSTARAPTWNGGRRTAGRSCRSGPAGLRLQRRALRGRQQALVGAPDRARREGNGHTCSNVSTPSWSEPRTAGGQSQRARRVISASAWRCRRTARRRSPGRRWTHLHKGTAFVFEHVGNSWVQNGSPLTGTGESGEGRFGESVAMAGNGSTVLVGAPAENNKLGAVWTFVFGTGRWSELRAQSSSARRPKGRIRPRRRAVRRRQLRARRRSESARERTRRRGGLDHASTKR